MEIFYKEKKDKNNRNESAFQNDNQTCCACGDCSLIHQQFTLEQRFNFTEETTVTVYKAVDYEPACVLKQTGARF